MRGVHQQLDTSVKPNPRQIPNLGTSFSKRFGGPLHKTLTLSDDLGAAAVGRTWLLKLPVECREQLKSN